MPKVEAYSSRKTQLAGWPVTIVTYRLGAVYHTTIENNDPGAWVVKAQGATQQAAETTARQEAEALLAKVKSQRPPTGCTAVPGF